MAVEVNADMKKNRLQFEIKDITSEGTFEGMLSPYGNLDATGDIVEPGSYKKTLKDHGNEVPCLWQHKTDVPIGKLTLDDRADGLWCNGQLLMALPAAKDAYLLIKAGIVKGLSIGFETVKDSIEGGVRHLREIRLYEGSIVTFPANFSALIASVKAAREQKDDFNEELAEIQLQDAGYQMYCALRCALSDNTYSDLTRDEKIAAADVILQQFVDAYTAYFPMYIDMLAEMYGGMEMWAAKRLERKAGAMFSAANKASIQTHCANVKDGADAILALFEPEADTSKAKPSLPAKEAAPKTEPAPVHSALAEQIQELKGVLSWSRQ